MAIQEHVDILKQGVEVWNQWRQEHISIRPDLRGSHLKGFNLEAANFSGANLIQVDLRGAHLKAANLIKAKLGEANLIAANLIKADLRGGDLIAASLQFADLRELISGELTSKWLISTMPTSGELISGELI